jgi:hypothetical protein
MSSRAASFIHNTFVVDRDEAEKMAADLQSAVEAKSGDVNTVDIERLAVSVFGGRYKWRGDSVKREWQSRQDATITSYNELLDSSKAWYRR